MKLSIEKLPTNKLKQPIFSSNQTGLVLFVALIALVAMSLAAAALVRTVDTGVMVAGNLAFKQSATMSADSGVTAAYDFFNDVADVQLQTNKAFLATQNAQYGYVANVNALKNANLKLTDDAVWTDAWSRPAVGNGNDATGKDTSGNTVRYIIERMSSTDGVFDATGASGKIGLDKVLTGPKIKKGGDSQGGGGGYGSGGGAGAPENVQANPVYRLTSRVVGPKNTVSYVQAYVY